MNFRQRSRTASTGICITEIFIKLMIRMERTSWSSSNLSDQHRDYRKLNLSAGGLSTCADKVRTHAFTVAHELMPVRDCSVMRANITLSGVQNELARPNFSPVLATSPT